MIITAKDLEAFMQRSIAAIKKSADVPHKVEASDEYLTKLAEAEAKYGRMSGFGPQVFSVVIPSEGEE